MQLPFLTPLRVLTVLIAGGSILTSGMGALWEAIYVADSPSMAAQGVGQDWVNLLLGLPLLLAAFVGMARGSRLASLVYGGVLFYFGYSFVIYAFGVHFNGLFLVYCAVLGCSIYAFVLYATAMARQPVAEWFEQPPRRLVAGYLAVVALLFYGLWLSSLVPALLAGEVPQEVTDNDFLVNPVHVVDLSLALPGVLVAAVQVRRGQGFGFVLAAVALVFIALLTVALQGMAVAMHLRGVTEDLTVAFIFCALGVVDLLVLVRLLRTLRKPAPPSR